MTQSSTTMSEIEMTPLRVWHIPQVPGKPFIVEVETIAEGVKIQDLLARYDAFQFEENIKPDYSNVSGIERWNERDREWEEVDEDEILEEGENNGLVVN